MTIKRQAVGNVSNWNITPDKHWCSIALALTAGAIGYSGHDGWGWCLFIVFYIECL